MSLQGRLSIFFLFIFVLVIASEQIVTKTIILDQFAKLENDDTTKKLKQITHYISKDLDELVNFSKDWGAWDSTYRFVDDLNQKYIDENLPKETFIANKWNFFILVGPNGEIVYQKSYNIEGIKQSEIPKEIPEYISSHPKLIQPNVNGVGGVLSLKEGNFLVVTFPILNSHMTGNPNGTLMIGRLIDEAWINQLREDTRLEVTLTNFNQDIIDKLQQSGEMLNEYNVRYLGSIDIVYQNYFDQGKVKGYAIIHSFSGKPALIIELNKNSTFYSEGQQSTFYFTFILLLILFVTFVSSWFFLNKHIILRLQSLKNQIHEIEESNDFSRKVGVSKHEDEITFLENEFNRLIGTVEQNYKELKHKAHHDPLTGLPNRENFYEQVQYFLNKKYKDKLSSIFYIDLDGFKEVNDTYGHHIGDLLLKEVGNLFREFGKEDVVASRIGGDEFLLFIPDLKNRNEAENYAYQLILTLKARDYLPNYRCVLSASIGISFYPDQSRELMTLIKYADEAMYKVKRREKDGFETFS